MINYATKRSWLSCLLFFSANLFICLQAQIYTPGTVDDLLRSALDLKNQRSFSKVYNFSIRYGEDSLLWNPWNMNVAPEEAFEIMNPYTAMTINSKYARGYNDGAIWKGKGLTQEIHAGVQGKIGKVYYAFQPAIFISQNSNFSLVPDTLGLSISRYGYQFGRRGTIDWVQQYGDGAFLQADWGQSEIRYLGKHITAAISTQNMSYGPVEISPILLSKNAQGLPHLHLGTSKPIQMNFWKKDFGSFEAHLQYGFMKESEYFDEVDDNDLRYFNSYAIGYTPPFFKEFTFGFSKVLYKQTRFFETVDLFSFIKIVDDPIAVVDGDTLNFGNDTFDQMASAFVEYHDVENGFKVYFELAKNDFAGEPRRFILELEHARAFALGIQKIYEIRQDKHVKIRLEHTTLNNSQTRQYRTYNDFYAHAANRQGYTHKGQIVGAGMGPGTNTDFLDVVFYTPSKMYGFSAQRISFDQNYFIREIRNERRHDVEYTFGFNYTKIHNDHWVFGGHFLYSYRLNQYFVRGNDQSNVQLNLHMRYLLN